MARKSKKIGEYTVHELSVREMLPLMRELSGEGEEGQIKLMGAAVHHNGAAIGDEGAYELGMSDYVALMTAVTAINGLDDNAGKKS